MTGLPRLEHIVATLGITAGEVTQTCVIAAQALRANNAKLATAEVKRAVALARQATALGNVLADVLDAIDTDEIAQGDTEAAREAVGA